MKMFSMHRTLLLQDDVLRVVQFSGITEVGKTPGLISLDFADVKTVMSGRGLAMMGSGAAKGQSRAQEANRKSNFQSIIR